jgi:type 1 glutamine amidotransferase
MHSIAWVRRYHDARVFCYVSGHGPRAFGDRRFRKVLSRGIRWAAGKT